jgi:DNA polymerase-3 subunit epsilon
MALDVETTGLNPAGDGMVGSLVPLSLSTIRASASRHWILKPRVPLRRGSVTIHGIHRHPGYASSAGRDEVLDSDVLQAIAGHVLVVLPGHQTSVPKCGLAQAGVRAHRVPRH